jgi:hypothetical protein
MIFATTAVACGFESLQRMVPLNRRCKSSDLGICALFNYAVTERQIHPVEVDSFSDAVAYGEFAGSSSQVSD